MTTQELVNQIRKKKSFLCVGLDVDLNKIPKHLLNLDDPIFEFNKAIIMRLMNIVWLINQTLLFMRPMV